MNNFQSVASWFILISVFVGIFTWYVIDNDGINRNPALYDEFAQCVADTGATMYGAWWCPHCKNEKNAFGDSFRFIPYVECTENEQLCIDKGVMSYPTWEFEDGSKLVGEQGLDRLARKTGCVLPDEDAPAAASSTE